MKAADDIGNGDSLTWEQFIGLTIVGEASIIYIIPEQTDIDDYDLRCVYEGSNNPGCVNLRRLFEQTVMRQIYEACDGTSCTEAEFVKFMAGPPFKEFGVQAWYQAGRPGGEADIDVLKSSNGSSYTDFLDNAQTLLDNVSLQAGCDGFACSWGNPSVQPPPPNYYASYKDLDDADYGVFNGRVYFVVGR